MRKYQLAVSTPGIPYYTYDEMQQDIVALQAKYSAFMHVRSLGKSVEGRSITEVILGSEDSKYHVLIQASMHAREYMNSILAMNQIEDYLIERVGCCRHLSMEKEWWEDVCFHVIPMVNPDGVTLCQNTKLALQNPIVKSGMKKNITADITTVYPGEDKKYSDNFVKNSYLKYIRLWKANARGVDLNRNFDIGWEAYVGAPEPGPEGYKGPSPASEPETQVLLNAARKYNPVCCIAYHSSGNLIYWDYGCQGEIRPRETGLAACIFASTGYPLHSTITDAADSAGCSDYFVLKLGIPAVTIENGEEDCPLRSEEYEEIYRNNRKLWKNICQLLEMFVV